jgi:thymidylate synthase
MKQYQDLIKDIFERGEPKDTRSGKVISLFGPQMVFDLRKGFPIVTTKKTLIGSVVKEILWFLRGETNINTLGCGIWNEWAQEDGELGPVYGSQWRSWQTYCNYGDSKLFELGYSVDQIQQVITQLKHNPDSRRHIVSAWNVAELDEMALPPCHVMFQFYVGGDSGDGRRYLDLKLYQRSCDFLLGGPFNIASYSILLTLIAREVGMVPRYFIHTIGDAHIYENHFDGAIKVLQREPLPLSRFVFLHQASKNHINLLKLAPGKTWPHRTSGGGPEVLLAEELLDLGEAVGEEVLAKKFVSGTRNRKKKLRKTRKQNRKQK